MEQQKNEAQEHTEAPPKEDAVTYARFTGRTNSPSVSLGSDRFAASSPLLSSTPPTVSKALVRSYPYILVLNKLLGVVTWTAEDVWSSVLATLGFITLGLYFEPIVNYFGHMVVVGVIVFYAMLNHTIEQEQDQNPTLDDVVRTLTTATVRFEILLSPISSLSLSPYDLKRLLFTTLFLSPIYIVILAFLLPPRHLLLWSGTFLMTYHSSWSRVTRRILWKSQLVRMLCFYLTGLDFSGKVKKTGSKSGSLFNLAVAKTGKHFGKSSSNSPIRFTYVLYENQRRWLGIGWTSNLLSYERTPWTDEFLNESQDTESFQLPQINDDSDMLWKWIDKTWRLDLTNDGSIQLSSSKPKTSPDPKPDEGFIYYDNTWKSPSTDDSFSRYTRRRRWIRTAELISADTPDTPTVQLQQVQATGDTSRKRKSIRFETKPTILESVRQLEEEDEEKKNL